jgi:hypothetical protein
VKVTLPSGCTNTVPAALLVTGSVTVTGVGPAGYTVLEPGRVKLATLTVVPGGGTALSSTLSFRGPLPLGMTGLSLASVSTGFTVTVSGTCLL